MALYDVTIEETVTETVTVEASSADEALCIVRDGYRSGRIVLEPGEVQAVRVCAAGPDGGPVAWEEL